MTGLISSHSAKAQTAPAANPDASAQEATQETGQDPQDEAEEENAGNGGAEEEELGSQSWAKADFVNFIDIRKRQKAPDPKLIEKGLRIITSDGFAPFNSLDETGRPQGYHAELSKLICEELNLACTLKVVPFAQIPSLLAGGEADIALAGLANHKSIRKDVHFSMPYLQRPARFLVRRSERVTITPRALSEKPIAVLGRSAHEAYLKAYFPDIKRIAVADLEDARTLLEEKKVLAIFADGMHMMGLVTDPSDQFRFAGDAYLDRHFFGEGMAIAYQRKQQGLKGLLDYALVRLAQKGHMTELYMRHFPLNIYAKY
ncbi:MAG: transporter substrate-binding domain-containing protein [Cohaesibacter sp.]|nr:transporter substrate-binding domain-containing protein [Cohaesibacter sp.]